MTSSDMTPSDHNGARSAQQIVPYGNWPAPVSAADLAAAATSYALLKTDGGAVYWCERRPQEGARTVIVRRTADGRERDVIGKDYSARSKVHEYGGGQFAVCAGRVAFVNEADQDLYLVEDNACRRLTGLADTRFADMAFDPVRARLLAVAERHEPGVPPHNTVVAVALDGERDGDGGRLDQLLVGRDFYSNPRPSPDGTHIAWLAWDLPWMPWQAAELWIGRIGEAGGIEAPRRIAGGPGAPVFQPEWTADGALAFVADHEGWGNLHIWRDDEVRIVCALEAELARPQWAFGMTSYAVLASGRFIAAAWKDGALQIGIAEQAGGTEASGRWRPLAHGFARVDDIALADGAIAIIGPGDALRARPHVFAADDKALMPVAQEGDPNPDDVSRPRVLAVSGARAKGAARAWALYYPPANASCRARDGERPPMVVSAHGGPTGMARRGFALERQYWTARGFAFLDVDYRGSSGYGRAFQSALDGLWGKADCEDAIAAVAEAVGEGLCDPARVVIRGSSAGGLTVLNALIHSDLFAAGASHYGVTDLTALAADTHKFESGYLVSLMGGMPDDVPQVYQERSPVNHADRITSPVIFFQGLDDRVVPPAQSRAMVASLKARGIPVASFEFAGEGHGFRKPETQIMALEAELAFYARILGLDPADDLPDVEIANFGARS